MTCLIKGHTHRPGSNEGHHGHQTSLALAASAAAAKREERNKVPDHIRPFIYEAIDIAEKEMGPSATLTKVVLVRNVSPSHFCFHCLTRKPFSTQEKEPSGRGWFGIKKLRKKREIKLSCTFSDSVKMEEEV